MWTFIIVVVIILIVATLIDKKEVSNKGKALNNREIFDMQSVVIGEQVWMKKNLDVAHYRNGDLIPEAKTEDEWIEAEEKEIGVWCYYKNDPENGEKYGRLYNWYAVNDNRKLAPPGWMIPSSSEWRKLNQLLGVDETGSKIKEKSEWKNNQFITNETGFSALPAGYRVNMFPPDRVGDTAGWWSSTSHSKDEAIYYGVQDDSSYMYSSIEYKGMGLSIRCIKVY